MADQVGDMTPDPTSTITASGHGILGFWQNKIIPKKLPILLFSDIEHIILSKVAHYSQLGTHCVQYYVDMCACSIKMM